MRRESVWACLWLLLLGCDGGGALAPVADTASRGATTASASGAVGAAPTASAAPVDLPAYAAKSVPEGVGADGIWTGAFSVARKQGSEGLTFAQAYEHCMGAGMALCSETQWTRACEADGKLAELETWLDLGRQGQVRGAGGRWRLRSAELGGLGRHQPRAGGGVLRPRGGDRVARQPRLPALVAAESASSGGAEQKEGFGFLLPAED